MFDFIKEIAGLFKIDTDGSNDIWIIDKFKKMIFPFGYNNSQYTAVKKAMENQISVIQL